MIQIRWYGFNPGVWLCATGTIGRRGFALSAIRGKGVMEATIRTTPDLVAPLRTTFPLDVERHEVEWMLGLLLGSSQREAA